MADDPHVGLRMDGDKVVGVDHAADTAPANVEKVIGADELELVIIAAYKRGFDWCNENEGDAEYLGKAARDYADRVISARLIPPDP